jgi:hypothetical protein
MSEPDYDEIVYVDEDGLGFTRRDFPACDFPVGTAVALAGVESIRGVVVEPHEAAGHAGDGGALEWVPVRWAARTEGHQPTPTWHHVDGLVRP